MLKELCFEAKDKVQVKSRKINVQPGQSIGQANDSENKTEPDVTGPSLKANKKPCG